MLSINTTMDYNKIKNLLLEYYLNKGYDMESINSQIETDLGITQAMPFDPNNISVDDWYDIELTNKVWIFEGDDNNMWLYAYTDGKPMNGSLLFAEIYKLPYDYVSPLSKEQLIELKLTYG